MKNQPDKAWYEYASTLLDMLESRPVLSSCPTFNDQVIYLIFTWINRDCVLSQAYTAEKRKSLIWNSISFLSSFRKVDDKNILNKLSTNGNFEWSMTEKRNDCIVCAPLLLVMWKFVWRGEKWRGEKFFFQVFVFAADTFLVRCSFRLCKHIYIRDVSEMKF